MVQVLYYWGQVLIFSTDVLATGSRTQYKRTSTTGMIQLQCLVPATARTPSSSELDFRLFWVVEYMKRPHPRAGCCRREKVEGQSSISTNLNHNTTTRSRGCSSSIVIVAKAFIPGTLQFQRTGH